MLHDRRSGAENQDENFKMRKLLENRSNEVSRKVECLDSRGNAHFGSADREIAPRWNLKGKSKSSSSQLSIFLQR